MKFDPASMERREAYRLLIGAVVPRPIAFVATISADGIYNLAPFSFFAPISSKPMMVGFNVGMRKTGQRKDTLVNIEAIGEYVISVADEAIAEAMNQTGAEFPPEVDEFRETGLTPAKADVVKAPLVAESPVNMECRLRQVLVFGEPPRMTSFVIGEVVRIHVRDELLDGKEIRSRELGAVGRLGGALYCRTRDIFEMERLYD